MDFINFSTLISLFLGIGLAAASGFRIFLPLFVLSVAAYFGADYVNLDESWRWIGSVPAMVTLGVAMLVEIVAYYIPLVDNFLDMISVPLAAVAGTLMVAANLTDMSEVANWSLAIIAGGGTAVAISSATATARAVSTTTTAGTGNFLVNSGETAGATVLSLTSIIWAPLAFVFTLIVLCFVVILYRKLKRRSREV
ncbi:DUF4126 domain-containing protein [Vaginella massiliensis]|uniref:DUF4126 domain-containing protein n=1 Tax=Vaginella massiliensis TaxID=1816680 RepID=UPI000838A5D9